MFFGLFLKIIPIMIDIWLEKGGVRSYENDLSAKEEIQSQGSWLQSQDEHCRRKKSISCQKGKGKKSIVSIGHNIVAFL